MLFDPIQLGRYTLSNRVVMAPMTRSRAGAGLAPTDLNAKYYAQRTNAGLQITEASQISPQGMGYVSTPGIYSPEQVAGWRKVTDAAHQAGGRIFLQLWHVGRISNTTLQPGGAQPVAPSAIKPEGQTMRADFSMAPFETPRALETDEITGIVADYAKGAANAIQAGFDGVELHGANGYLIDQFLRDGSNKRTDRYGGSVENRVRFMTEATQAVVDAVGADRVGIRLSPNAAFNDMKDGNPRATFGKAAEALNELGIAYIHATTWGEGDGEIPGGPIGADFFRPLFKNRIITAAGYTKEKAEAALKSGGADLVAFGSLYISNPDLVERLRTNGPLAKPDRATMYGGDAKGYTDYPTLEAALA
ncbi:MAG TPA: alkene reductase [Dongiaceae bacterium]|jgi:N-ethylmaleimide reductase